MTRRRGSPSLCPAVLVALALSSFAGVARAQDGPPPVRRQTSGGGGGGGTRFGASHIGGSQGIRPFLGVSGHLDVDSPTSVGGNKFLFGADYFIGGPHGFAFVIGMHLGAGGRAFLLNPLLQVHYRFPLNIPLVPYIGGGVGLRLGFARQQSVNLALTFRFVGGVEYYFTDSIAISTELAIPDLGPRFTPSVAVVGTIEWLIGPHFRF